MSKKRLRIVVILLTLCCFCISTAINYYSSCNLVRSSFTDLYGKTSTVKNMLEDYYLTEENLSKLNLEDISLPQYIALYTRKIALTNFPYAVAVTDADGNILAKTHSTVYVVPHYNGDSQKNAILINIDQYITRDIKKQLKKYQNTVSLLLPDIEYFAFRKEEGEYIPVKLGFKGYDEPVIFCDKESNVTFTSKTDLINLKIHSLEAMFYEESYYEDIDKYIDDALCERSGGSSTQLRTSFTLEIGDEFYVIWISAKYSPFIRAVTSSQFQTFTLLTALLFLVIGALVLIISQSFLKKSQQIEKSKHTFISAAAHELKTPLAVIQNQCECILEDAVPEKRDEYIKSIYDESLRMNDIVSSLLTFNRLSSADKIKKEKVNLSLLLETEVNKYISFAVSNGAMINLSCAKDIYINCNGELMALAIDNYLSNAVKYTTGEKKITVTLTRTKSGFNLEVYNTAEPIAENEIKNLWNILERKDTSRTRKGNSTGVGLAICKRVFEIHGFKGECRNENEGIIFSITGKT